MIGKCFECLSCSNGVADCFIVNIRDVSNMLCLCLSCFECPAKDIMHDKGSEVADVSRAVDSWAAAVEAKCFAIDGREFAARPSQCVVKLHEIGRMEGGVCFRKQKGMSGQRVTGRL